MDDEEIILNVYGSCLAKDDLLNGVADILSKLRHCQGIIGQTESNSRGRGVFRGDWRGETVGTSRRTVGSFRALLLETLILAVSPDLLALCQTANLAPELVDLFCDVADVFLGGNPDAVENPVTHIGAELVCLLVVLVYSRLDLLPGRVPFDPGKGPVDGLAGLSSPGFQILPGLPNGLLVLHCTPPWRLY